MTKDFLSKLLTAILTLAFFTALIALIPEVARAQSLINSSVRALGMGNAFTALAMDKDSLFYNPSGLARTGGMRFTVLDPYAGVSGIEALDSAQNIQSVGGFSSSIQELYGSSLGLSGGGKVAFVMPYFGMAAYTGLDGQLSVHNPAYPELNLNYIRDEGFAIGTGFAIIPGMNMGFVAKRINRAGTSESFGVDEIGTLNPDIIFANLDNTGVGYSFDFGLELAPNLPSQPVFAFVWKDVGDTSFKADTQGAEPASSDEEMIVGAALTWNAGIVSLTPSMDIRHLNDNDMQLGKKINMGVELGLPLIDLRGGFHQGYYTAGASFNLGPMVIDAATYGVELGEYPGQLEDRRYVLQATIEFGFDVNFGNSSSNSNSSYSKYQKRLKQRR